MNDIVTSVRKVDRIMYVCTDCHDAGEEICCYADRRDLGVMPDGRWLCENCLAKLPEKITKGLKCPPAYASAEHGTQDDGIDLALTQLCKYLGVDPKSIIWDAATETVEGDVMAVIGNIMCAKYGDDFTPQLAVFTARPTEFTLTSAQGDGSIAHLHDELQTGGVGG